MPAFAVIGLAMGATAATATAVGVATTVTVASVAAQGYSMYKTNQAARASAGLATDVADYNARVDLAEAKQIELDSTANTLAARAESAVYLSRQKSAYAAAGVLSSGSPLDVQATTAGALEQRILQDRQNAGREVAKREASARVGVLYGQAESSAIRRQNGVDMLRGGIGILSTVASAYQGGMFSGIGQKTAGASMGRGMLAGASGVGGR